MMKRLPGMLDSERLGAYHQRDMAEPNPPLKPEYSESKKDLGIAFSLAYNMIDALGMAPDATSQPGNLPSVSEPNRSLDEVLFFEL